MSQIMRQVVSAIQHLLGTERMLETMRFACEKRLKPRVECRVEHRDVVDSVDFPLFGGVLLGEAREPAALWGLGWPTGLPSMDLEAFL